MKLTIIKNDGAVYKDEKSYLDLSLPTIPTDVHALQWNNDKGHIEFTDNSKLNEQITELPSWANDALTVWQQAYVEEQAAILAAEEEARLEAEQDAILAAEQATQNQTPSA